MSIFSAIRSLASAFLQRGQVHREMEEELRSHIQHRADDLQRRGISRKEAERRARLEFGGFEKFKEEAREALGGHFVETLFQDIRFSVRSLRRTPGLTIFVIVTLALGIGMVSGTFSMVDALIFRPYPVPHPSGIVTLVSTTHDSSFDDFSYREYLDLRDKTQSYAGVIANSEMKAVGFSADAASTPDGAAVARAVTGMRGASIALGAIAIVATLILFIAGRGIANPYAAILSAAML